MRRCATFCATIPSSTTLGSFWRRKSTLRLTSCSSWRVTSQYARRCGRRFSKQRRCSSVHLQFHPCPFSFVVHGDPIFGEVYSKKPQGRPAAAA